MSEQQNTYTDCSACGFSNDEGLIHKSTGLPVCEMHYIYDGNDLQNWVKILKLSDAYKELFELCTLCGADDIKKKGQECPCDIKSWKNTNCSVCGHSDDMELIHKYTGLPVCQEHYINECSDCGNDLENWDDHESADPNGNSVCLGCGEKYNN